MDFITLTLLSLGLAADAFAVSVTDGICGYRITKSKVLLIGITFGFFQAIMPTLGFFLGKAFFDIIHRYQHWVALFLLMAIGINMLSDAVNDLHNPDKSNHDIDIFSAKNIIMQGIATSIDALAAGVSFAVLQINILSASFLIGLITFLCCCIGVCIGKIFGSLLGLRAKFFGGIILLAIGAKIFVENQFFP